MRVLKEAEFQLQSATTVTQLRRVMLLRATLRAFEIGRLEKALLNLKRYYYEKGNKADMLLA